jgi:hypothetical protein
MTLSDGLSKSEQSNTFLAVSTDTVIEYRAGLAEPAAGYLSSRLRLSGWASVLKITALKSSVGSGA